LCRLISFRDGSWIVVDPEGRFDTNNLEEIQGLHWIMPDDPFKPLPVEIFMREYYEPRLLPRRAGLKQVTFSAYGFNVDKVKSATARKTYRIPGSLTPRKGRVYLITVGVNAYQNAAWDLTFAANDARRIAQVLSARLHQDNEPPEKRPYQEIVPILLLSDYRIEEGRRVVTAKSATKANLRAVLDRLAGKAVASTHLQRIPNAAKIEPARPEDLVLISFSSHGFADARGIFYFFPYDIGKSSGQTITPSLLQRAISSAELSVWLRDVDAGELVMIVDACHAAATVQAQGSNDSAGGVAAVCRTARAGLVWRDQKWATTEFWRQRPHQRRDDRATRGWEPGASRPVIAATPGAF
jgi:hypothetical protein